MISPYTRPGTKVLPIRTLRKRHGQGPFKCDVPLTIRHIETNEYICATCSGSFWAVTEEAGPDFVFSLCLLRLLALPKAITDCLEVVDLPLIIEEFKRQDADADARLRMPY